MREKSLPLLLLKISVGAVEKCDAYVFVKRVFNIFVFDIDGCGSEHDVGYLHYVKEFSFMSKMAILQPPQLAAQ